MTFAIYYETSDLDWVAGAMNADTANVSQADKNLMKKYWQGGINGWATAPLAAAPGDNNCPLCHRVVVTYGNLAEFRALLVRLAEAIGGDTLYLKSLSEDMGNWWGATEPYP